MFMNIYVESFSNWQSSFFLTDLLKDIIALYVDDENCLNDSTYKARFYHKFPYTTKFPYMLKCFATCNSLPHKQIHCLIFATQ